ncbi:MAG: hypothetical protein MRY32_06630 [Rickettsiales bacterium]|nr:hypothetical protein [Rickettsiales bacterium]
MNDEKLDNLMLQNAVNRALIEHLYMLLLKADKNPQKTFGGILAAAESRKQAYLDNFPLKYKSEEQVKGAQDITNLVHRECLQFYAVLAATLNLVTPEDDEDRLN